MIEIDHELLEIALAHLAVGEAHARFGQERLAVVRDLLDGLHFVVHEVDLPTTAQLAQPGLTNRGPVPTQSRTF